jgi:phosphocarrier protein
LREFRYVIHDKMGLHAQPAGYLVKTAMSFPCKVTIGVRGKETDAKRIMAVAGLQVKCGEEIILKTDGEQEEEAMDVLSGFIERNL